MHRNTRLALIVFALFGPLASAAKTSPFEDCIAVYHFAGLDDSAGANSVLKSFGAVRLNVELSDEEKTASRTRGGDGKVVNMAGGWFTAGQGADGELNPDGDQLTLCIRLRDPSGRWNRSLLSKHGGHDKLVYNLFSVDLGQGMVIGFELGTDAKAGMTQVKVPVELIGPKQWHDVIVRYDGKKLALFVDGVPVDDAPATGRLRKGNSEPCVIGGESMGGKVSRPFRGMIDHAALWDRALSDEEIAFLSGGRKTVNLRAKQIVAARIRVEKQRTERLANDPHRPGYHFLPPRNWMNDPNGLIHYNGEYHLFYQHNPKAAVWGNMTWGHAVSKDLVHWKHLPYALEPTDPYDRGGVFSGCAVNNDGVATLVYTGVSPQVQCIATADETMRRFTKHPANPVIAGPPDGLDVTGFRDPCVWREGQTWRMVVGSGIKGVGGTALLYKSPDLIEWEYVGRLLTGNKEKTGTMWECPNFFRLGDKHVLIVSTLGRAIYFIGTYKGDSFSPERRGEIDMGGYFYAPQTFADTTGRRIMFGWLWEGRPRPAQVEAGWAGVQSLPRVLQIRDDGELGMEPAKELRSLRGQRYKLRHRVVSPASSEPLDSIRGSQLEMIVEINPGSADQVGLKLLCSPDSREQTLVYYDRPAKQLRIDRRMSSLSPRAKKDEKSAPLELSAGQTFRLHVFVDHSVVEVFADGRVCLTSRVYPTRADSVGVGVFARGGTAELRKMDVWKLASIWPKPGKIIETTRPVE